MNTAIPLPKQWESEHDSIHKVMAYLNEFIEGVSMKDTDGNIFFAAMALRRCVRLLEAVDEAVDNGFGDTVGGNLRTICDTWILGHYVLLSDPAELEKVWAESRFETERVAKALEVVVDWPDEAPDAKSGAGIAQRAKDLSTKLEEAGDDESNMPVLCYEKLYRSVSLMSAHANIVSILGDVGADGVIKSNEEAASGTEWLTMFGAMMVIYFALRILEAAGISTEKLEELGRPLAEHVSELES